MATFTIELWKVLEIEDDPGNGHKIGLGSYPIPSYWQDVDRDALNKLIIDHYWNREIGQETISIFEHRLQRKMNEVMRLYNQLYESTKIKFDPLSTFNLTTVREDDSSENVNRTSNTTGEGDSVSNTRAVSSTPPQNQLAGNGQYATGVTDTHSDGTSTNSSSGSDTSTAAANTTGTSTTTGYQGSASRLLNEFRSTILNIDLMVVNDLEELFMGIYDTGTEMLPHAESGFFS